MANKRVKAIIDTNVIVSGILSSGSYPSLIIDAWLKGNIQTIISDELKNEVTHVLQRDKFLKWAGRNHNKIKIILGTLFNKAEMVIPVQVDKYVFTDKKDHFLFELGISADVDAIVTGDNDILKVKKAKGILFLDPKTFCQKYKIK